MQKQAFGYYTLRHVPTTSGFDLQILYASL